MLPEVPISGKGGGPVKRRGDASGRADGAPDDLRGGFRVTYSRDECRPRREADFVSSTRVTSTAHAIETYRGAARTADGSRASGRNTGYRSTCDMEALRRPASDAYADTDRPGRARYSLRR